MEKISQIARVASPNRKVKKTKGEEKKSAVLTKGKVVPQIKVNKSRNSSALRDGLNISQQILLSGSKASHFLEDKNVTGKVKD